MHISAKQITTDKFGKVVTEKVHHINLELDDRVLIHDGSYINDIPLFPVEETHGMQRKVGIVARMNSVQVAEYKSFIWDTTVEMPIVVITDNGEVLYCNPLNIRKC